MTRRLFLFSTSLAPLVGQSRAERGRRVVDAALQALGGTKFLAMEDRQEAGRAYSFSREGELSGLARTTIYTRYVVRPNPVPPGFFGLRLRQTLGKDEDVVVLYTEDDKGWDITYRGAQAMPEADVKRFQDAQLRSILYILRMRLDEPGLIIESQGSDVLDNQPVEIVDITDSENRTVTVWFHQSTKLPIQQRTIRRQNGERQEEVTVFSKYRDVGGGVMWPFTWVRRRNGEKIFEMFSESVAINQGLSDTLFTISADTKVLSKKKK